MAVQGPGLGTLMDACLALVPTAAPTSSEAEVALCKSISCNCCQDLPPPSMAAPLSLASVPSCQPLSARFPFGRVWWERMAVLGVLG